MKTINTKEAITMILVILFACIIQLALAGTETKVKSKTDHVTIFPNNAQVTRTGSFTIEKETTQLMFEGVSSFVNSKSIQVRGKGDFIILDVQYYIKQPDPVLPASSTELPPKIVRDINFLQDSLQVIAFDLQELAGKKEVLTQEKSILMNNPLVKGNGGDTIPELESTLAFFRVKLNDINAELLKIRKKEYAINLKKQKMEKRLNELRTYNTRTNPPKNDNRPIPVIVVNVSADQDVSGSLELCYLVNNAGWSPMYDLRATGTDKPVKLIYKADVWQNTGEEWDDVELKLSTITPRDSYIKPVLPVWYLNYNIYNNYNMQQRKIVSGSLRSNAPEMTADNAEDYKAKDAAYFTSTIQTMTNVEYEIKLKYSIPSDGKTHSVAVLTKDIPTEYDHFSVPKMDKQVYLLARLSGWSDLDLLPANASIYYNGTYVGETVVNPATIQDTMDIAMGTDRSILVTRKKITEESKVRFVNEKALKTIEYEITIRNNKQGKVNLCLEDHIPISQQQDIKVKIIDDGGAAYSENTGMLTWDFDLGSKETKKIRFSYSVEYDKSKPLAGNF